MLIGSIYKSRQVTVYIKCIYISFDQVKNWSVEEKIEYMQRLIKRFEIYLQIK